MKKALISILSLLLALTLLSGCASDLAPLTTKDGATKETEEKTQTESEKESKEETKKTEEKTEEKESKENKIMQKGDPAEDETLNILMIGNSFCYYYVEELYGMLDAVGIKANVCNVYYSGCSTKQHWSWFLDNASEYKFYTTNEKGRQGLSNMSLKKCLQQNNWDVISLQQHFSPSRAATYENAMSETGSYAKKLFDYLKGQFPQSGFYWHQTWAYEKGYNSSNNIVETLEQQTAQYEVIQKVCADIAKENNVSLIPCADSWQLARKNPVIGDTLCIRKGINEDKGDHYHDGDLGGGQYLNACVWFEVLTGKSCIGNSYRPNYTLNEEKIEALQEAAHKAVADLYGTNFVK